MGRGSKLVGVASRHWQANPLRHGPLHLLGVVMPEHVRVHSSLLLRMDAILGRGSHRLGHLRVCVLRGRVGLDGGGSLGKHARQLRVLL